MEELSAITPVNFFQLSLSCRYLPPNEPFPRLTAKNGSGFMLPDTSVLCNEEHFADVAMAWNEKGLDFYFKVEKSYEEAHYPDIFRGDSIEVFIDTRDVKTSGYNTRFCHHFYFLPEAVDGHQAGEITHFRTEDVHELCPEADLLVKSSVRKGQYAICSHIPRHCLFGFEPGQFDRFGFSYRINRPYWESQHFSVVTEDYQLEQQPSLWSRTRMVG